MPKRQTPGDPIYRGSSKHKNRPANEQKGTLCPEWTHRTATSGLATDVHAHDWPATPAAQLFARAVVDSVSGRRYATAMGIAFEAKASGDGTWHGYPIPWESVPPAIVQQWKVGEAVKAREIKAFFKFSKDDIHWALKTDTR